MTCPNPYKEAFSTKAQAKKAIRDMERRARRGKGKARPMQVYHCQCGYFHHAGKATRRHC
ncbi:hypothetical protein Wildcat_143 [Mycobacterium phage Wildcat]|uniref:Uncharacterized protein n=4 Tax=Mycobacterium virus Wildcat TaxID=1993859 RepID=Q19XU1_9CAUD|nr:hypothetical protein Wildcat_143 [Mycobacterium phage Wildcat]AJD82190.1 hypothetical protein COSMO_143 [Mycobacterium phage Cosmo]QGJ90035.1 hypothetical protein PBI_MARYV_129 [Mycobacterium phage MaryV]QHB49802.1 hypothetical protein EniyanLRS_175 [Mycobacterium phage EniyanLRS]WKR36125.1 hypothetical protein [Mycobacterium phage Azrael100]ABE67723.1 hypothetical protein Wildcat_143 [Mycobacterium phage Wildcat]